MEVDHSNGLGYYVLITLQGKTGKMGYYARRHEAESVAQEIVDQINGDQ